MMSGASAYDTSNPPWRGGMPTGIEARARAQRTLRRVIVSERAAELLKARHQT
jgi:hypothetical protein